MSITSIISDIAVGGSFLNWSILWLSGINEYYYYYDDIFKTLTNNPLTNKNAHNFRANKLRKFVYVNDMYSKIKQIEGHNTVFFHNFIDDNETEPAIHSAFDQSDKIVRVKTTNTLYHYTIQSRASNIKNFSLDERGDLIILEKYKDDREQFDNNFVYKFFKESYEKFKNLDMNEIWDYREFLALNIRPYNTNDRFIKDSSFPKKDYYLLKAEELWFCLDKDIINIFDYLNLSLDNNRFEEWLKIYNVWKEFHWKRVKFQWYLDEIINLIIEGRPMDLKRFDLDVLQESVIQHFLLYKHNLNLKTFGLEKFENTLQLHNLLEPNVYHQLEKIY
jgi:hypothetical protein